MNNKRRKSLASLIEPLEVLKSKLDEIEKEERKTVENIPTYLHTYDIDYVPDLLFMMVCNLDDVLFELNEFKKQLSLNK